MRYIVKRKLSSDMAFPKRSYDRSKILGDIGFSLTPRVSVDFSEDWIETHQIKTTVENTFVMGFSYRQLMALAQRVDEFHKVGLVHGDLCTSNIGIKSQKVLIFDWEPSLEHKSGEIRTTPYCIHPDDLTAGIVTNMTDKYSILLYGLMIKDSSKSPILTRKKFNNKIVDFLKYHTGRPLVKALPEFLGK